MTITAIGRLLHLERKTVRKFARASRADAVGSGWGGGTTPLLSRFLPHLNRRWQEGYEEAVQLFAEIEGQGYRGSPRTLRRYLTTCARGSTAGGCEQVSQASRPGAIATGRRRHLRCPCP